MSLIYPDINKPTKQMCAMLNVVSRSEIFTPALYTTVSIDVLINHCLPKPL